MITVDLLLLPRTDRGNIAVLVAVDHCNKFTIAVPIKDKKAETVTRAFAENVLPRLVKLPDQLLSDKGS